MKKKSCYCKILKILWQKINKLYLKLIYYLIFQNLQNYFSMIKNHKTTANSFIDSVSITPIKNQNQMHQGLSKLLYGSSSQSQPTSKKKFQRKNQHSPRDLEMIKNRNKSFRLQQCHRGTESVRQKTQFSKPENEKQKNTQTGKSEIVNTLESSILASPLFIKQTQILKRMQQTNIPATKKQITTCQTLIQQILLEQNKENNAPETRKKICDKNITSIEHLTLRKIQQNPFRPYQKTKKGQIQNKIVTNTNIKMAEENKKLTEQLRKFQKEIEQLKKAKIDTQTKYNKLFMQHKRALEYIKILSKQKISKQCRELQSFRQMSLQVQICELKNQLQSSREQRQRNLQYQLENSKLLISRLESDVKSLKISSNILQRKTFKAQLQCRANRKSIEQLSFQEPNSKIYQQNKTLKKKINFLEEYLNEVKGMKRKNIQVNLQRMLDNKSRSVIGISRVDMEYSDEEDSESLLLQLDLSESNK